MTLADITFPITYQWGISHALVFDTNLAQRLLEVQAEYGDPRHIPSSRQLVDGRFMLTADILTECVPGGIMYGGFSHLDSSRFSEIEILPIDDAITLLPSGI